LIFNSAADAVPTLRKPLLQKALGMDQELANRVAADTDDDNRSERLQRNRQCDERGAANLGRLLMKLDKFRMKSNCRFFFWNLI
jgi:hypothetical protein